MPTVGAPAGGGGGDRKRERKRGRLTPPNQSTSHNRNSVSLRGFERPELGSELTAADGEVTYVDEITSSDQRLILAFCRAVRRARGEGADASDEDVDARVFGDGDRATMAVEERQVVMAELRRDLAAQVVIDRAYAEAGLGPRPAWRGSKRAGDGEDAKDDGKRE